MAGLKNNHDPSTRTVHSSTCEDKQTYWDTAFGKQRAHGEPPMQNAPYRGWKQEHDLKEEFRNIAQACVRETEPCLELMLPSNIRDNRKVFYNCIGSERMSKENVGTLMNGSNVLATDKAESASWQNLPLCWIWLLGYYLYIQIYLYVSVYTICIYYTNKIGHCEVIYHIH